MKSFRNSNSFCSSKHIIYFIILLGLCLFTFIRIQNYITDKKYSKHNKKAHLTHHYVQNIDYFAAKLSDELITDDLPKSNSSVKPRKNVENYYYLSEDKLIEEVYDSLKTDYDYYERGSKYDPGQVKAMLTTITYQNDYLKLLDTLLEKGFATPFITPKQDFNILLMTYAAASSDKIDYLNVLLKHGADLTIVQELDGATLLHAAARNGNIDLSKKVLDAGVPVNKEDKRSKTPVYYAIENNEYEMVKFLVEKGAKIEEDFIEITNDRDVLAFLLSKFNQNKDSKPYYENPTEDKEWEEAYKSIEEGDLDSLIKIEKSGKDLSKMYYKGEPAACLAIRFGETAILKYLIGKYDFNKIVDKINNRNVLHYAVMYYKPETLKFLLRNNYNPNVQDKFGNTPLHYAAENPYPDYTKYLLKYGANPNTLNNKKRNTLFSAVKTENTSEFENLIDKGADINQVDSEGNNPLQYALKNSLKKSSLKLNQLMNSKPRLKLHESFESRYNKLFTKYMSSNSVQLFKMSKDFYAMPEEKLIEELNKICEFNSTLTSSSDYAIQSKLQILFFLKIAMDKDYPKLLNEVTNKGIKLEYWKFNYLPATFYLADKNSIKCLNLLNEMGFSLSDELSYEIGRLRKSYKSTQREDRKMLYLMRQLTAQDRSGRKWNEFILNLDDNITEEIDDDEIQYELDIGKTLLHSAAQNGNIQFATKLIELGIPVNKTTEKGNSVLYYAAKNNQSDMVKFLLSKGAKVDEKAKQASTDTTIINLLKK